MNLDDFRQSPEYIHFKTSNAEARETHLRNTKYGLAAAIGVMLIVCICALTFSIFCVSSEVLAWKILGAVFGMYAGFVLYKFSSGMLPQMLGILNSHDFRSVALILGNMVETGEIQMTTHIKNIMTFALVEEDESNASLATKMATAANMFTKSEVGPVIGKIKDFDIHDYVMVTNKATGESKKLIYQGHHDTDPIGEFNKAATKDSTKPKIGFVVQHGNNPGGIFYMEE